MNTMVVGTDGSETASQATLVAGRLAAATGARLHLVSAYRSHARARVGNLAAS